MDLYARRHSLTSMMRSCRTRRSFSFKAMVSFSNVCVTCPLSNSVFSLNTSISRVSSYERKGTSLTIDRLPSYCSVTFSLNSLRCFRCSSSAASRRFSKVLHSFRLSFNSARKAILKAVTFIFESYLAEPLPPCLRTPSCLLPFARNTMMRERPFQHVLPFECFRSSPSAYWSMFAVVAYVLLPLSTDSPRWPMAEDA